jgi:hypothetical protein
MHALSFARTGLHRATRSQLVPIVLEPVSSSSPAQAPPARSQPCACRCHAHACTSRYPQLRRLERSGPPLACRARRLQLHPWLWYRGERRDDLQRSAATPARARACVLRTRDMCDMHSLAQAASLAASLQEACSRQRQRVRRPTGAGLVMSTPGPKVLYGSVFRYKKWCELLTRSRNSSRIFFILHQCTPRVEWHLSAIHLTFSIFPYQPQSLAKVRWFHG